MINWQDRLGGADETSNKSNVKKIKQLIPIHKLKRQNWCFQYVKPGKTIEKPYFVSQTIMPESKFGKMLFVSMAYCRIILRKVMRKKHIEEEVRFGSHVKKFTLHISIHFFIKIYKICLQSRIDM